MEEDYIDISSDIPEEDFMLDSDIWDMNSDRFDSHNENDLFLEHDLDVSEINHGEQITFEGNKYSDAEIERMKDDVERAEYEVSCRKSDVSNWESKVSLNDTPEHRENGDYSHAVNRLNEATSRYNDAVSKFNNAKSKLNNAI